LRRPRPRWQARSHAGVLSARWPCGPSDSSLLPVEFDGHGNHLSGHPSGGSLWAGQRVPRPPPRVARPLHQPGQARVGARGDVGEVGGSTFLVLPVSHWLTPARSRRTPRRHAPGSRPRRIAALIRSLTGSPHFPLISPDWTIPCWTKPSTPACIERLGRGQLWGTMVRPVHRSQRFANTDSPGLFLESRARAPRAAQPANQLAQRVSNVLPYNARGALPGRSRLTGSAPRRPPVFRGRANDEVETGSGRVPG
jgi:hypothetical protein